MLEKVEAILNEYSKDKPDFQEIEKSVEKILNLQDGVSIFDKEQLNFKFDQVYGYNLIHFVIMHGHLELLKKLLNDECSSKFLQQKTKSGEFPIDIAIEYCQVACLKLLLRHYHSEYKQKPELKKLVKKTIDNKNIELLEAFLSGGVFIEQNLSSEDEKINNLLKQRYHDIERFIAAAKSDNAEIIEELINKGIHIESKNINGENIFDIASANGASKTFALLYYHFPEIGSSIKRFIKPELAIEVQRYLDLLHDRYNALPDVVYYIFHRITFNGEQFNSNILSVLKKLYGTELKNDFAYQYLRPLLDICAIEDISFYISLEKENIERLFIKSSTARGAAAYKRKTIYIAGNHSDQALSGTIAHEMTHMVCQVLWDNKSLPYVEVNSVEATSQTERNKYLQAYNEVKTKYDDIEERRKLDELIRLVFEGKSYTSDEDFHAELIVRIPHIIASYGEEGIKKLQEQAPLLLTYYRENFLPKCKVFLQSKKYLQEQLRDRIKILKSSIQEPRELAIIAQNYFIAGEFQNSENIFKQIKDKANNDLPNMADLLNMAEYYLFLIACTKGQFGEAFYNLLSEIGRIDLNTISSRLELEQILKDFDKLIGFIPNLTSEYFSMQGGSSQELEAELSFQQAIVYQKLDLNEKAIQNLMRIEKLAVSDEMKVEAKKMAIQVIKSHFNDSQTRLVKHSSFATNRYLLFSNASTQTDEAVADSLSTENELVPSKSKGMYNQ